MGQLTYQEALDKAVKIILGRIDGYSLDDSLKYFEYWYNGYFCEKDEKYIKEKIIENKSSDSRK